MSSSSTLRSSAEVAVPPKSTPPPVRPNAIVRASLEELLAGASRRVTLLSAPPGFGKTSLLAAWAERSDSNVAWLTLDRYDNEPARLWAYVIQAVRRTSPYFGDRPLALLRAPGIRVDREVLPALIDALTVEWPDGEIVLDDYHHLHSVAIHEQVAYLVDHGPPGLRLTVSTRADPPLPLPRWRAGDALLELRMNDLHFTERETEELLASRLRLALPPRAVSLLHARTEGWPAGLHLAALSLRGRDDPEAFVERFAGTDRHLVDYLGEELLARVSPELREFLLQTAVLDRLSPSLCDAVLGIDRSGELLTQIEAANGFLIPLDDGREWYRYHTLFAELLRQQLRRREPARVAALHKRASEWFERNDASADAVHHALESGDLELSAERIATHWHSLVTEGLNARLAGWLEAIPEEVLASDVRLCLAMAWTLFSLGRLDEMGAWVELVETAPLPAPFRDGTASREAGAANLRASRLNVVGDTSSARQWAERALRLQPDDWPWRAIATLVLGNAQSWLGRPDAAIRPLEETVRLTQEMAPLAAIQALGQLALLAADRGDWPAAERLTAEAAEVIDRTGTTEYWMTALWRAARARIEQHRGGARTADALSERAIEVARRSASPPLIALALLQRARILSEQGSRGAASACLFEAEAELRRCPDPRVHRAAVDSIRRMIRGRSERSSSTELTDRELAVLRMLGSPLTQREIGSELYVSLNTVKTHVNSIRRKLCASSRAEAVTRGRELGLI